jgi:hypothetical protein
MTPRRQTIEIVALVVLFLSITLFTVVGFTDARWLPPPAASRHAAGVDGVIHYLILTTGVILLIGTLAMVVFLWRFGRGRPAPAPRITPRNERWVTMVPVLGMALIAEAGVLVKGLPVWEQIGRGTAGYSILFMPRVIFNGIYSAWPETDSYAILSDFKANKPLQ